MTREELITEVRKYRCSDLSDGMDAAVRAKHYENLGYEPDSTLERLKE